MNALTRVDPFDPWFPQIFRRLAQVPRLGDDAPGEIRIDVTEKDKEYEVRAEIPGAKKEDVRVQVDGNFVSIAAEVRKEKEEKSGSRVVLRETYVGNSSRGFALAHEVDASGVVAKLEDGILKLTLPKREGGKARAIEVQ